MARLASRCRIIRIPPGIPNLRFMAALTSIVDEENCQLLKIIRQSSRILKHLDLLEWLQGDFQNLLSHDVLIAAWGDFSLGLIQMDVISPLPNMRTRHLEECNLTPLLQSLFNSWSDQGSQTILLSANQHRWADALKEDHEMATVLRRMVTAVVHGIKDHRGRHDCLYVALTAKEDCGLRNRQMLPIVLPYIDAALRQIPSLPKSTPDDLPQEPIVEDSRLSTRESEIMEWVRLGKTNGEIATILNISTFTVKNHMQRILRKLDVVNRAQAVAKFSALSGKAA
ncbi:MAG: transcriptional regulator EpsA [Rhodocyclaceae bacterium]|nr:transcriptional regulator EpsA [Rhodocyclaceae bacterium]